MRRLLRMIAVPALMLFFLGEAGAATAAARPDATPATCTGTDAIQVTQFTFTPPSVTAGQSSTANLTAVNCTAQTIQASALWYGRYQVPGNPNIPPGCPAIDPLDFQVTIAPGGQYTQAFPYFSTFTQCTATQLLATVLIEGSGVTYAQATATLNINTVQQPVGCHVTYTVLSEWRGGFSASIAITNTGTQPFSGWWLNFQFGGDQKITNLWGASFSQNQNAVALNALSYDMTIAPGATLSSVGMNGTWTTSDAPPTKFFVMGNQCV
jgi:Cellulose binding domain